MRRLRTVTSLAVVVLVLSLSGELIPRFAGGSGPPCTDADGDGLCADVDCDDRLPDCGLDCTDSDLDGICVPADCDDGAFGCTVACADTDDDGVCDDRDNCPAVANPNQDFRARLNNPPVRLPSSEIPVLSSDGRTVVYHGQEGPAAPVELFASHISGNGIMTRLNPSLGTSSQAVLEYALSAGGTTVVYRADQDADEVFELYSVPIEGGPAVKINGSLVSGGDVTGFLISGDGANVVYRANQVDLNSSKLYSVPIGGGTPVRLNGPPFGWVHEFLISPDGGTVVYRAESGPNIKLYSVPIGGGTPVELNDPLLPQDDVHEFKISPDGARVVYVADPAGPTQNRELFSVPIGSGTAVKLNGPLVSQGDVIHYLVSPDSARVVYVADQEQNSQYELYSVPIEGGTAVKLNSPLVAGGGVFDGVGDLPFRVSPNSATVVYVADQEQNQKFEIYSVPIEGGFVVKLNGPLQDEGGGVTSDSSPPFQISPDGTKVVYWADQDQYTVDEIYSVPIGGGTVVKLNEPLAFGRSVGGPQDEQPFLVTPDGNSVVYRADQDTNDQFELYIVPIEGGTSRKLAGGLIPQGDVVGGYAVDPGSSTVVYVADAENDGVPNLYRVSATLDSAGTEGDHDGLGGACDCNDANPLCTTDCTDDDGDGYCLTTDCNDASSHCTTDCTDADGDNFCGATDCDDASPSCMTNCADSDGDGLCADLDCNDGLPGCGLDCTDSDLDGTCAPSDCDDGAFGCALACADTDDDGVCDDRDSCPAVANPNQDFRTKLNDPPIKLSSSEEPVISPDGRTVLYRGLFGAQGLFASHVSGNGTMTGVTPIAGTYELSADGVTVVFVAAQDLFSVSIEGGPAVQLGDTLVTGEIWEVLISGDGASVVYRAGQLDYRNLYRVPIGGGAAVELSQVPGGQREVKEFLISPDGATVVYRANQDSHDKNELYRVPIDGGAPIKLNLPLVTSGNIEESVPLPGNYTPFAMTPDGARVVYLADQEVDKKYEIYSVPMRGGAPVKLNQALASTEDIGGTTASPPFLVSPDSARVLYLRNSGKGELFSVPIGGGTAVKLNGPVTPGGQGVGCAGAAGPEPCWDQPFMVSPDSSKVVYTAMMQPNNTFDLFSVPIDGGTPIKLNPTLVFRGNVGGDGFRISPDGTRVVYVADQDVDHQLEIYSVSIDGGPAVKLNGALVSGQDVASEFVVTPDSTAVVYRADQDTDGKVELYIVPIAGGPSTKLSGALIPQGDVTEAFMVDPQTSTVLFVADAEIDGSYDLYRVSIPFDANGADADADGSGAACDCDDQDMTVHLAPVEVSGVFLQGGPTTTILFETQDDTAGTSTSYEVAIGDLGALTASGSYSSATCLGTFEGTPALDPLAGPAHDAGRYYLVRGVNSCGAGTYGDSTVVPDPRDDLDAGVCP